MAPRNSDEPFRASARDTLRDWLEDALGSLPELSFRRMFGGTGVYVEDSIFGILYRERVYLKTSQATRGAFIALGSEPLRARSGAVLTAYYEVPVEVLDDDERLLKWARKAVDVAREAPEPRKSRHVDPEQILAGYAPEIQTLAQRARGIVRRVAADATEAGYPGWHLIGYRAPHYFCFVAPQPDHVRLGFEHGHALHDPKGLLEPMGKQVRFVRLVPGRRVPVRALAELIEAALAHRPPARARKPRKARRTAGQAKRRTREPG